MSSFEAKGIGTPRKVPRGGYEPVSVTQLAMVWWAYRTGLITKLALRAYFACIELEVRRRLSGGKYQPSLSELRKLVGGSLAAGQGGLRPVVNRLLALGLLRTCSKAGIAFAQSPDELRHEDRAGLSHMLGQLQGITRKVPVPRRMLRRLAGGLGKARTAVVIAHLIRCLFYRKAEGINPVGCCKASWIAEVFGITERSVYDARKFLVELDWLLPQENTQHILNRNGLWVSVNLDWGPEEHEPAAELSTVETPPAAPSPDGFSGPQPEIAGHFSGPSTENKNPLREINNQKPASRPEASGGPAGVQSPKSEEQKPTLRDIVPEDLRNTGRLLELHRQAVEQKLVTTSEADRLKFLAGAAHAQAVGSKPCRLFAWMVQGRRWEFITQADEDSARSNERKHLGIARRIEPAKPAERPKESLSADALLVRTVQAAVSRAGYRGDPFPLLKRERPEWTRERWDLALAELARPRVAEGRPSQSMAGVLDALVPNRGHAVATNAPSKCR